MSGPLTAGRVTKEYAPLAVLRSYPMDATAQIWQGGIVALDSTGYAVPGSTSTTLLAVGVAQESKLAGSVDGDTQIQVHIGVFHLNVDSAFSQANVGSLCYIVDDETVSLSSSGKSIAGTVAAIDADGAWVAIGLEAAIDNTTLTAFESSLASASTPGGASLVGVYDVNSLITTDDVNSALLEIVKKANAALSGPGVVLKQTLSAATSGAVLMTFTANSSGKLARFDASVATIATTTAAATLIMKINGTTVAGASMALTTVNCATQGARVTGATITSANSFVTGDTITINALSASTPFTQGEIDLLVFFASA